MFLCVTDKYEAICEWLPVFLVCEWIKCKGTKTSTKLRTQMLKRFEYKYCYTFFILILTNLVH